jgi:hypothetical protein
MTRRRYWSMSPMSLTVPEQLPPQTARYLRSFVRRRRLVALLRAAGASASLAILWLLSWGIVDRLFQIPAAPRVVLGICLVVIVAAVLAVPVMMLLRTDADWRAAAGQIESRDARFGEALETVVAQNLAAPEHRGSPELVEQLSQQVESLIGSGPRGLGKLVPVRPVVVAWSVACSEVIILLALSLWPWLSLPQLLARQLWPLANVAPVTSTHLTVTPGSLLVVQGEPIRIVARGDSLDSTDIAAGVLRVSSDGGRTWSVTDMMPATDGTSYTQTLTGISRDMIYEVLAGDATAGPYELRVIRASGGDQLATNAPTTTATAAPTTQNTQASTPPEYRDALNAYFQALEKNNPEARQ